MATYLGKFCEEINLKIKDIKSETFKQKPNGTIKTGLIFELKSYQEETGLPAKKKMNGLFS